MQDGERRAKLTSNTREVRCPFYAAHSTHEIECEGVMDGCLHVMRFQAPERKRFYQRTYCEAMYDHCEYYRMIMAEKYAD